MASNVDSTPSNFAFTSRKRKKKNFSFDLVKQMVYSVDDNAEPETLKAAWQKLKSIFEAGELEYAGTAKKSKLEKSVAASTIKDIDTVISLFGLDHWQDHEAYIWEIPDKREIVVSEWLDSTLKWLWESDFLHRQSAEALCRTSINLVIFGRLSVHKEVMAARKFSLKSERSIVTQCLEAHTVVSGIVDYVWGYDTLHPHPQFESCLVVVEAKKTDTFEAGVARAVTYMVGTQQHSKSLTQLKRVVHTLYGMVSDGMNWQFLRLDGNKLLASPKISSVLERGRLQVFQYVDAIINAAIASSPHTTPNYHFSAIYELLNQDVEVGNFGVPFGLQKFLQIPDKDFLVDYEEEEGDTRGVEYFDVVRNLAPNIG